MPVARFAGRPYDLDFIASAGWVQLLVMDPPHASVGSLFIRHGAKVEEVARAMGAEHNVDGTYDEESKDVLTVNFGTTGPNRPKRPGPDDWTVALVQEVGGKLSVTLAKSSGQSVVAGLDGLAGPIARLAQRTREPVEASFEGSHPEKITRLKLNRG